MAEHQRLSCEFSRVCGVFFCLHWGWWGFLTFLGIPYRVSNCANHKIELFFFFFFNNFWPGLNLKQTSVKMFSVPANFAKFSDECTCTHRWENSEHHLIYVMEWEQVTFVHFCRHSGFSSSGPKSPFLVCFFSILCSVWVSLLCSHQKSKAKQQNEATWNFKNE